MKWLQAWYANNTDHNILELTIHMELQYLFPPPKKNRKLNSRAYQAKFPKIETYKGNKNINISGVYLSKLHLKMGHVCSKFEDCQFPFLRTSKVSQTQEHTYTHILSPCHTGNILYLPLPRSKKKKYSGPTTILCFGKIIFQSNGLFNVI